MMGYYERKMIAFVGVFLVLFPTATFGNVIGDAIPPSIAPIYEKICEKVECGRGKCRADKNNWPFGFTCECDNGWKRAFHDTNHTFLPCTIPNCNLNTTCVPAPAPALPPAPNKHFPIGSSFDPCSWIYCGGGTCKKAEDDFKHTCECNNGFTNLLNKTYFPCFGKCDLGSNCSRIISSASAEESSGGENAAIAFLPGKLQIIGSIFTFMVVVLVQ